MNVSVVTNRIYNAHCFPTFDAEIHKYRFGFSASKARTLRSVEAVENLGAFLHMGSTWVLQNSSTEVSSASDMSRSLPSPPPSTPILFELGWRSAPRESMHW
ncbi:hypothetical protein PDE_01789 [Penicillium oxalicum 114-2]|uniref:Uncharacterized protein n=1 Tax=Penicillium oxalicum (strain 114-2 / CGMCC 5302) TaxID=933388 RepID=S7Z9H9_PENO1|nr:hypothetical protein PDE_01789 [Penicillium oxalicum 114-2]